MVLAIVFIFASAVITLPAGPTWSQRFWNGLIAFGLAMAAVVVVTLLYALLFAPYQQRNKLRRELSAKEEAAAYPVLVVQPEIENQYWTWPTLIVINHGVTDDFQAVSEVVGDPSTHRELRWNKQHDGPKRQNLVSGARARVYLYDYTPRGSEVQVRLRLLSDQKKPFVKDFTLRTTRLGVTDLKSAEDEWPVKVDGWCTTVDALIETLTKGLAKLETQTDHNAASAGMSEFAEVLRKSGVVGASFRNGLSAVHTDLSPNPNNQYRSEAPDGEWIARYMQCVKEWISDLRAERDDEAARKNVGQP